MFERDSGDPEQRLGETPRSSAEIGSPPARPEPQAAPNRPAENARVGSPSELGSEWRGGEGATDFLGLDQELFGALSSPMSQDATYGFDPTPLVVEDASVDPDNWLMGLDDALADDVGREAPGANETPEPLEASWSDPENKPSRLGTYVLRGLAAVCLMAVGVTLTRLFTAEPGQEAPPPPVEPSVARAPRTSPNDGAEPVVATRPTDSASTTTTTRPVPSDDSTRTPGDTLTSTGPRTVGADPLPPDPAEVARVLEDQHTGRIDPSTVGTDLEPIPPESMTGPGARPFDDVALVGSEGATPETGPLGLESELRSGLGEALAGPGGLRYATADDMAGIFDGTAIPLEAIDGTARIVTPNVGRVRAVLDSGEIFEGRLYAVGEGKIWLEVPLGRMALVGQRVSKIDHVLTPEGSAVLGDPGSIAYSGLPRVRVKVPGGMFFGKLIEENEESVTLITEEGARITLRNATVEPAPLGKRIVVKGYVDELAGT